MEFTRDFGTASYKIQAYQPGCIKISGQDYFTPVLILPEKLIAPWKVTSFKALTKQDFLDIYQLKPEVVLIGVANNSLAPSAESTRPPYPLLLAKEFITPLTDHGIGVEVMDTMAACRTYTVLMSEGRNVAAGLFL